MPLWSLYATGPKALSLVCPYQRYIAWWLRYSAAHGLSTQTTSTASGRVRLCSNAEWSTSWSVPHRTKRSTRTIERGEGRARGRGRGRGRGREDAAAWLTEGSGRAFLPTAALIETSNCAEGIAGLILADRGCSVCKTARAGRTRELSQAHANGPPRWGVRAIIMIMRREHADLSSRGYTGSRRPTASFAGLAHTVEASWRPSCKILADSCSRPAGHP